MHTFRLFFSQCNFKNVKLYYTAAWPRSFWDHSNAGGGALPLVGAYDGTDRVCFWQFLRQKGYGFQSCVPERVGFWRAKCVPERVGFFKICTTVALYGLNYYNSGISIHFLI